MIRRGPKNSYGGFTLVELLIVIVIMGILLVLGVVNLRGTQANARDSERTGDTQTIATSLEAFYPQGNTFVVAGEYPSTALVASPTTYLVDINTNALIAPSQTTQSLVAATNATQTTTGVTPQPTISQYVYQPIASDGTLCTTDAQGCRKFNLYYRTEIDNVVHQIVSRHQ
jgi:prepilin-type N-terminal cleavage/methylation domain-containing protein